MKRLFFFAVLAMMVCSSTAHIWAQQKTPLMEKIDAALEQARNLGAEKKYTEALKAANDAVEYLPQPVKETYKPYAGTCYGVLSWNLTLNKQYAQAAEASKKALTFATSDEWTEGSLAHAYLMLGKTQEAEKIYRKHIGKTFGEGEDAQSWSQLVLEDFKLMREAGIDSPAMAKIEQIFEQEKIKLRNANEQEKIKLRNANKNKNIDFDFAIPETSIIFLARVSPNGEFLLARTLEDQILLIDLLSGEVLVNQKKVDKELFSISDDIQFTPDSKQVAIINNTNPNVEISYYDLSLDTVIRKQELKIPSDKNSWNRFTFSPDGALIVLLQGGKKDGDAQAKKCYFYDVQKDTVLGENIFQSNCYASPNPNATVVLSADNKFLFLPECEGSETVLFNFPTYYRIVALETIKTGKGKFIEATIIDTKNNIIDISASNDMFVREGRIPREKDFFKVTSNAQYHYYKFMNEGKFLDKGTYYPWVKSGEFICFLPGGQRGLFIYHTDKEVRGNFNRLQVANISQLIAQESRIISEKNKAEQKAEQAEQQKRDKTDAKIYAQIEAGQKSLKPGDRTNKGLVLKREGDRVLVQPDDGKAADAKWYKIYDVVKYR